MCPKGVQILHKKLPSNQNLTNSTRKFKNSQTSLVFRRKAWALILDTRSFACPEGTSKLKKTLACLKKFIPTTPEEGKLNEFEWKKLEKKDKISKTSKLQATTLTTNSHQLLVPSMWFWSVSWLSNCPVFFSFFWSTNFFFGQPKTISPVHVVLVSLLVDRLSGLFLTFLGRPKKYLFSLREFLVSLSFFLVRL